MIPPPFRLFRFFNDYDQKLGSAQTAPHIASSDFIGIFGLFLTKNFPKNTTGHISTFFFYIKKVVKVGKALRHLLPEGFQASDFFQYTKEEPEILVAKNLQHQGVCSFSHPQGQVPVLT